MALQKSEEQFRSAFGHAAIGMAMVSPDGRFLLVNRALCQTVGYSESEILDTTFQAITHPDDLEAELSLVRQILAGKIPYYQMEKRYFHKRGHIVPVLKSVSLVHDGHGKPLYFVAHIQDVTARKQAENALRESEARFRTVVRATNDVIWEWDLKTDALWWSDSIFELFGYPPGELEPSAQAWINRLHPDDKDRIVSSVNSAIRNHQQFWSGEYRFRRADASYAYVYDRGYIQFDESGAPARMTGSLMDITDSKQAEKELRQREEQLWEMLGERGQLSQDLHDNLIQKIYAIGLNLEESKHLLAEDLEAAPKSLDRAIGDLNGVIRDVRNYIDRIDPGIMSGTRFHAELAKLVQDVHGALQPRFHLRLDLNTVARLNTEEAKQLLFIAREALSNSLRHSHAKTGVVSLRTEHGRLYLEITDDGIGFDSHAGKSSGLGLRNMAARAQKLGGRFAVASVPGQGTRIIVEIPQEPTRV
jgi:PAS domain S-box-containing protein